MIIKKIGVLPHFDHKRAQYSFEKYRKQSKERWAEEEVKSLSDTVDASVNHDIKLQQNQILCLRVLDSSPR